MLARNNRIAIVAVTLTLAVCTAAWKATAENANGHEDIIEWGDDLEWSAAGVWVLSIPTPMGNILLLHNNQAQDLTGSRLGGTMLHVNDNPTNFGMFPDVDESTGWVTQTVRTGPTTFATTMLIYGTKIRQNAPDELATIGIASATWEITGPDTKEGQSTYAVYLASQDADGDGFPDEGEEPVSCTPFTFTGRRLRVMPPCALTPMPEAPTQ